MFLINVYTLCVIKKLCRLTKYIRVFTRGFYNFTMFNRHTGNVLFVAIIMTKNNFEKVIIFIAIYLECLNAIKNKKIRLIIIISTPFKNDRFYF